MLLSIDTNQTAGNLVHKYKTMKFDVVVERPVTDNVYPNQLNRLRPRLHGVGDPGLVG